MLLKNIKLFGQLTIFEAYRYKVYPSELVSILTRRFIELALYISFWLIISNYSTANISAQDIIGYYLIINGLTSFLFTQMGAGSDLIKKIKTGELNQILIKPMPALFSPFSSRTGKNFINLIIGFIQIIVGIFIAGGINGSNFYLLPILLFNALVINVSLNIILGSLGFYFVEAGGIKNIFLHIINLCGGVLMPLFFMPVAVANALQIFTPFPAAQYQLTIFLQGKYPLNNWFVLIGFFWALLLLYLSLKFWRYSLTKYEAVGS
jgi:ABC-2 type transport system permease protein